MTWQTLIDVATLAEAGGRPDWLVVDCRFRLDDPGFGRRAFAQGHIPGACYAHLDEDLSGPVRPGSGRHPLPDPAALAAWLGRRGLDADVQVVAYDDSGGTVAARLWWLLRWLGHPAVAVLDGGLPAWTAAGLPLSADTPDRATRRWSPRPGRMPTVGTAELAADPGDYRLLDARAPERFRGEHEPMDPVAGHVPGAVNRPTSVSLDEAGRFRPTETLRAELSPLVAGAPPGGVVAMCGSGVTACHLLLALEHVGLAGAALYAGSWSEWIRDSRRPVATGPG